jgi:hypothetical protein
MACHTAKGGEPMAGGGGIESPLGTIWSSNITPDKETGIGNWTLDQFRAAMVDGVGGHGQQLYPAMPYENYRFMKESDMRALFDYIQTEVKPVKNEVQATSLSFRSTCASASVPGTGWPCRVKPSSSPWPVTISRFAVSTWSKVQVTAPPATARARPSWPRTAPA